MTNVARTLALSLFGILLVATGCATGNQPVSWSSAQPIDTMRAYRLAVTADVPVPDDQMAFLQENIKQELDNVFHGVREPGNPYSVKVTITRYDEGSAFARFMLAGLGQMYLDGDVQVTSGNPPAEVRVGQFRKNYSMGGLLGVSADMKNDMVAKVGKAIAQALTTAPVGPPTPPAPATALR